MRIAVELSRNAPFRPEKQREKALGVPVQNLSVQPGLLFREARLPRPSNTVASN